MVAITVRAIIVAITVRVIIVYHYGSNFILPLRFG
jgi:hypothetical protein